MSHRSYIYRSGDLARWLPDGCIEFLGRIDHQVKIRGFRVEPGEIESRLLNYPGIKEVAVLAREEESGNKYLCAYMVSVREYGTAGLREFLAKELPDYMIPSYFVPLEKIPLTPNGKIDRRALPAPGLSVGESYTAPGNEIEKKLVEIWTDILSPSPGSDIRIGIADNFFQLGGHSLKATILAARIQKVFDVKVPLQEIFKTPRIKELAKYIKEKSKEFYISIKPAEKKEYCLLSSAQKRLYILQRMNPDSTAYNIPRIIPLPAGSDRGKIEEAFKRLVERHESLRTSFHLVNDLPVQKIHDQVEFEIENDQSLVNGQWSLVNCQGRGEVPSPVKVEEEEQPSLLEGTRGLAPLPLLAARSPQPASALINSFIRPFDLSRAPLLRVGLVKNSDGSYILLVDLHHIISDGVSHQVLVTDYQALYNEEKIPPLLLQYKDFSQWQNGEREKENLKRQEAFWVKEFAGEIPVLNIPTDYPRPLMQSYEGNSLYFEISAQQTRVLKEVALQGGATLFMVLAVVFNILLSKLSGQEDIVIGVPVAGRRHADLEKIIGMFVSTLALRNYPSGEKGVMDFLGEVKEVALKGFENQEYQYEDLVEQIPVNRDPSRNPLFDTMLMLQNTDSQKIELPGLKLVPYEYENKTSKFDLTLTSLEIEEKLLFTFEYSTKLFKRETIERLTGYLKNIIDHIISNPCVKILEVEIISEETRKELLNHFNEDLNEKFEIMPIQSRLANVFLEYKENTAIEYGTTRLTYAELEHRAAGISQWIANHNILAGSFIGIYSEDKIHIISSIIAILQKRCIFVPLDIVLPRRRVENMIRLTNMRAILTDNAHETVLISMMEKDPHKPHIFVLNDSSYRDRVLDDNNHPGITYDLEDKIYVYFTSGTTGMPNAIVGKNKSLVQFVQWEIETFIVNETYRISQLTAPGFDAFLRDVFVPLFAGGTICIPGNKDILMDGNTLIDWLDRSQINLVHCVPGLFYIINAGKLTPTSFLHLKYFLLSGEPINPTELRKWYRIFNDRIQLVNYYGPTETTMIKTFHPIGGNDLEKANIPAGFPMRGARVIILDRYMKICDRGIVGEIYIRTAYDTHGYLDNPGLNAGRFIKNPFNKDGRDFIYKTGDMGRRLENGEIEILGRIDRQVKIRGIRVELGNIENCLLKHSKVEKAIIINRESESGENFLGAYIVFKKQEVPGGLRPGDTGSVLTAPGLKEHLAKELPDYMIPSYFIPIEKVPLTANGKIDIKALPEYKIKIHKGAIAPRTAIEEKLTELWAEILGIGKDMIGIDSNFFQLGGHSLTTMTLLSRIHRELDVRIPLSEIFKTPRIKELAKYIKEKSKERYISITPTEEKEYYPLSSAQKRLYILQRISPDSTAYNMPEIIPLPAEFDWGKINDTFKKLIKRHGSLRTSFHLVNDMPVQKIHKHVGFELDKSFAELFQKRLPEGPPEAIIKSFIRPFDLSAAPLLQAGLVKNSDGNYILLVDMHHIISDGVSHQVLVRDYQALYNEEKLPSLRLQYKDFSQWQNGEREKENLKRQEAFWVKEFAGEIPVLDLPTDYPRPLVQSFAGNSIDFEIAAGETKAINALALREGATLFMVLAAVFNILLFKLSGQEEIIMGTPVAGRRHADLEKIIGMFVNTLTLKNYPVGARRFREFLVEVKERLLIVFENQEYPFEELVDKLSLPRDTGRNPLFDVMFVLQNMNTGLPDQDKQTGIEAHRPDQPGLKREYENLIKTAKFDLTLNAEERNHGFFLTFQYCTQLFKKETIERFIIYFKKILSMAVKEPGIRISDLEILAAEEKKRILDDFNNTTVVYPKDKTVHRLFEEQAAMTPDGIALVGTSPWGCPGLPGQHLHPVHPVSLTYRELNEKSLRLAGALIEEGIEADTIVGIMIESSVEMIIGVLGILRAGGAYMPIPPDYPRERIEFMLKDSAAKILVTTPGLSEKLLIVNCQLLIINEKTLDRSINNYQLTINNLQLKGTNLAYIIYTSGSTGRPKGVMVGHRSLVNLCCWHNTHYSVTWQDRTTKYAGFGFDASVWEIFPYLITGASLYIVPNELIFDIEALNRYYEKNCITISFLPTQMCEQFMELNNTSLRAMLTGGDKLKKYERKTYQLYNNYGPTENTVVSTSFCVTQESGNIPIGNPVFNNRIYILDRYYHLQPIGVHGELYIGGESLARGYVNNPELTAERFCRWQPGGRFLVKTAPLDPPQKLLINRSHRSHRSYIYRTGDLARWLLDGNIEFLGRIDNQVKIRGFRIEMGEIESQLMKHAEIKEAIVVTMSSEKGDRYLCAYIAAAREFPVSELKGYLLDHLPGYMIPSEFVLLGKIPLTSTGKVDRQQLSSTGKKLGTGVEYVAPRSDNEVMIAEAWKTILKVDAVGIYDNFFDLGGTSMDLIRLNSKLQEIFKRDIPVIELYRYTTIDAFSNYLGEDSVEAKNTPASTRSRVQVDRIKKGMAKRNRRQENRTRRSK